MHAGGTGVIVVNVAPMGVAVIPIFEPLNKERVELRCARSGTIATASVGIAATIGISAAALVVSATAPAAIVVSTTTAAVGVATTAANGLSLLALALLLAMTATTCSTILAMLLPGVLEHTRGGLFANGVTEHLNLPLQCIDGGVVIAEALLRGGVCCAKVGDRIGQGGSGCIVFRGIHAIAMLQGRDGRKQLNVDGGFPKSTERN